MMVFLISERRTITYEKPESPMINLHEHFDLQVKYSQSVVEIEHTRALNILTLVPAVVGKIKDCFHNRHFCYLAIKKLICFR